MPHVLLAVTQHAHTIVVALDARGATSLTEPQLIGKIQLSATGRVLAYELLEDINPLNNVVVAANLATGAAWRVVPGGGCAAFGFTLDATGERLALLQVAMRGRFKPTAWQVSVVDFASGRASALGPARPQKIALEPVAWLRPFTPFSLSLRQTQPVLWPGTGGKLCGQAQGASSEGLRRGIGRGAPWPVRQPALGAGTGDRQSEGAGATDEIVLRAFVPFQADGAAGLWAVSADGSRLRPLLPETDYVGKPRLSPDGRLLAFFASEPENLPEEYVASPGEPPANALRVLNLITGETRTLAVDTARAFDALAWDAAGERLYLTRGAWRGAERTFRFDEVVSLSVSHSTPEVVTRAPESVVGLQPCAGGGLAYVTAQGRGAVVRWDGRSAAEWIVENGAVEILSCLPDE
jgi:dipeptidyl aminopeptidase/acylaminoacyl peptidase